MREQIAEHLRQIDPSQPLGTALHDSVCRVSWSIAVELVVLRCNPQTGAVEVLLRKRGTRETYPGEWHCPGGVLRPNDQGPQTAIERVALRECGVSVANARDVGEIYYREERGPFLSKVFLVDLRGEPTGHRWWNVRRLPKRVVWHHRDRIIPMALAAFCTQVPAGVAMFLEPPSRRP